MAYLIGFEPKISGIAVALLLHPIFSICKSI
jgi:hypothetical protein